MLRPQDVVEVVNSRASDLEMYCETIDIMDGELGPYVDKQLSQQLSKQSYWQAKQRLAPINVLPKIIDKLTNIYQTSVSRTTELETDQKLVDYYVKETALNSQMNCANEFYNSPCGAALIQPYVYKNKPRLRVIPNDKFVLYSDDPYEPNIPTDVILIYGKGQEKYYWVYNEKKIYATDGKRILTELMLAAGMTDDSNFIGKLPFVYANSAKYKLVPTPDRDGLTMVKLLPVMMTDLNHAAMFQCFSILFIKNAQSQVLQYSPNAVWELNVNPATPDNNPEIGSIKPEVDYDQVIKLVESQLSMWLGSKGIKSSSIGGLTQDNFASGISKIIDEMDTYEARQKQVTTFMSVEEKLWDLIANYLHPYWIANRQIEDVGLFSPNVKVTTKFAVQLPQQSRGTVVKDLQLEVAAGFISRKRAIAKLNPEFSEKEIQDLMEDIDEENNGPAESVGGNPDGPQAGSEAATSGPGS